MRVLSIWSALAERYNRRIDEDDIVDIRTGEIIKDRGVLSELPKRYNFGDLADKDEDPAINTDLGSEAADILAEDEDDDGDEDEEDVEETDAFPASDGLVSPQITRLAPLRPTTGSSDADDLRRFLEAEAIRRELDGGDDSSEDEFNILPPRSSPAKRTMTPARKTPFTTRAKPRPPQTSAPDTESEDEFAAPDPDRNHVHRGYRARRTPSPEVPASISSPPPPSSSPGPSSSFSLPSSPLSSRTPLNPNSGPQTDFGSPTPKRKPITRRAIEDSLNEIDLEFPPPQPRAPSIFRPSSAFIIDLSLSDGETEDDRPLSSTKATSNPKPVASESRTIRENNSTPVSKRPVPFVLIEKRRPAPSTATPKSAPSPIDPDSVAPSQSRHDDGTSPTKGRPRTRSLKVKPPDLRSPQSPNRGGEGKGKHVKGGSREEGGDVLASGSTPLNVDETPIKRGRRKKVKSSSLSPAGSESSPKAKTKPRGKRSSTRLVPSDDGHGFGSDLSPAKRIPSSKSSPGSRTQVTTPEPDPKPKSTRRSAAKPKFARTTTAKPKSKAPKDPPKVFADVEGDDRSSPPLPPSPSPAPLPRRVRVRSALKRKRIISSGSSSAVEKGSPKADLGQLSPPPNSSRNQACTVTTSDIIDVDGDDHGDNPEAGTWSCLGFFYGGLT